MRHGETSWNVAGRWQGQADPDLTEQGEAQARDVAAALAGAPARPWRRVVSSDLLRARRTAEVIAEALGVPLALDPRLRERDAGRWSGLLRAEVREREPELLAAFLAGDPEARPGGGENTHEVRTRALAAIASIVDVSPGEPTILVSHLGWIRTLLPEAEGANGGRTEAIAEELLAAVPERARADEAL